MAYMYIIECIVQYATSHHRIIACIGECASQSVHHSMGEHLHRVQIIASLCIEIYQYIHLYITVCTYHCIHITHTLSSSYHTMQHHIIVIIECKSVSSLYSIHIIIPLYSFNTVHTILVHHHHANIPWTILQMMITAVQNIRDFYLQKLTVITLQKLANCHQDSDCNCG